MVSVPVAAAVFAICAATCGVADGTQLQAALRDASIAARSARLAAQAADEELQLQLPEVAFYVASDAVDAEVEVTIAAGEKYPAKDYEITLAKDAKMKRERRSLAKMMHSVQADFQGDRDLAATSAAGDVCLNSFCAHLAEGQVAVLYASWPRYCAELDEYDWAQGTVDTDEQKQAAGEHSWCGRSALPIASVCVWAAGYGARNAKALSCCPCGIMHGQVFCQSHSADQRYLAADTLLCAVAACTAASLFVQTCRSSAAFTEAYHDQQPFLGVIQELQQLATFTHIKPGTVWASSRGYKLQPCIAVTVDLMPGGRGKSAREGMLKLTVSCTLSVRFLGKSTAGKHE